MSFASNRLSSTPQVITRISVFVQLGAEQFSNNRPASAGHTAYMTILANFIRWICSQQSPFDMAQVLGSNKTI